MNLQTYVLWCLSTPFFMLFKIYKIKIFLHVLEYFFPCTRLLYNFSWCQNRWESVSGGFCLFGFLRWLPRQLKYLICCLVFVDLSAKGLVLFKWPFWDCDKGAFPTLDPHLPLVHAIAASCWGKLLNATLGRGAVPVGVAGESTHVVCQRTLLRSPDHQIVVAVCSCANCNTLHTLTAGYLSLDFK